MSRRSDMRRLLAEAKADLQRDGDLVPRLLVRGEISSALGFIQFGASSDERRAQLFAVGVELAGFKPQYVVLASDTYMRVAEDDEPPLELDRSLADDPKAGEAVVVISLDRRGRCSAICVPYDRHVSLEETRIQFKPPVRLPRGGRPDAYVLQGFWDGVRAAKGIIDRGGTDFPHPDEERRDT